MCYDIYGQQAKPLFSMDDHGTTTAKWYDHMGNPAEGLTGVPMIDNYRMDANGAAEAVKPWFSMDDNGTIGIRYVPLNYFGDQKQTGGPAPVAPTVGSTPVQPTAPQQSAKPAPDATAIFSQISTPSAPQQKLAAPAAALAAPASTTAAPAAPAQRRTAPKQPSLSAVASQAVGPAKGSGRLVA